MTTLRTLLKCVKVVKTNLCSFDIECGALRTNSLECNNADTFVCIKGTRVDGHDFIETAVNRGANLIICEHITPYIEAHPEIQYVVVENTRLAVSHMWNEIYNRPAERLIIVAVTGTNGKTSTTYFLNEIFKAAGYVTGIIGTVRCMIGDKVRIISDSSESNVNAMTTPEPEELYCVLAEMERAGVEIVFIEASSHSLSQYRLDPIRFTAGIFTGLSSEHLDYHGTMEDYYLAKRRLFDMCESAVICADSDYADRLQDEISIPSVTYSKKGRAADYSACSLCAGKEHGVTYTLCEKNTKYEISCNVTGEFMASNTLAAVSCARLFGITPDVIARGLKDCPQVPGRMERLQLHPDADFSVYIDFAHTPDALENVLTTLKRLRGNDGRLVVLFGCGGDRDRTKRPIMGKIATTLADMTIITSDNSRSENPRAIICDILHGVASGSNCKVIENREKAIRYAIENHQTNDIILLAGKGHEDYEIDASGKHSFSEKSIVSEAVSQIYGILKND